MLNWTFNFLTPRSSRDELGSVIIDISPLLCPELAGWDGDQRFLYSESFSQAQGASVTVGCAHGSLHLGAHVDAPRHFRSDGEAVSELPLESFWGPAQIVDLTQVEGSRPLMPEDFRVALPLRAPRLLLKTRASLAPETEFYKDFVYPSPQLASYLGALGVLLLGTDAPSMDRWDDPLLPGHHALYGAGISILEGLRLAEVDPNLDYELSALPLKIKSGDAGWTRAALKVIPMKRG